MLTVSNNSSVYNFWEPLHLYAEGYGFKTWELSPTFALRSWAYIMTHYLPVRLGKLLGGGDKVSRRYPIPKSVRSPVLAGYVLRSADITSNDLRPRGSSLLPRRCG